MPTPTEDATARIADYVLGVRADDLPAAVRKEGQRSFLNVLGCTIGGARHEAVAVTDRALRPFAGEGPATLIGLGRTTDALTAGLIITYSSSVNTNDVTHAEAIVHPGGPIMAAVMAVADGRKVSGADMLTAFILGVEITCRLSKSISVAPAKGDIAWSQTGVTCGIGAALAAAKLLGLDAQATRRAIGIAASDSCGIRAVHGSMCTAFLPARAGQIGLRAAYLAQAGFTCNEQVIEHRYGFVNCFAQTPHYPYLLDGLGTHFEILSNTYKPFPCGIVINPLIDAALQLRAKHDIDAGKIERVDMNVSPGAMALCFRRHPKDEFEGQVSLYHWVAAAFVRGKAGISEGTDAAISDPVLVAFRDRIEAVVTPEMAIDAVDMTVVMKDGKRHAMQLRDCIGSKGQPMTDRNLEQKFEQLAEGSMPRDKAQRLIADCWQMDKLPDAAVIARGAA
jgi:2-methylcitrate dehydratase PrpD